MYQAFNTPNLLKERIDQTVPAAVQGILFALASSALFIVVGALVRILNDRIGVFQILLFRQLVFILLLLPAVKGSWQEMVRPRLVRIHLIRICGAFASLYLGFVAFSNLELADATALGFTQVLFVAAISRLFLGESVGFSRILTIGLGFAGVILIIRPDFSDPSMLYILAGLGAAMGAAVAASCVRRLTQTESKTVLLTYQAVFVGLIALIPAMINWHWPTLPELGLLVVVGVVSSVATWLGVSAYKLGEANIITNVSYVKMIYSMLLGYWLFDEIPDQMALLGVLILVSSVFVSLIKRRLKRFVTK